MGDFLKRFVFSSKNGRPLRDVRTAFSTALRKSGIAEDRRIAGKPELHFHDLRHTHATALIEATDGDLDLVRQSLGHKTMGMVQRYAHLTDQRYRNGLDKMDSLIFGGTSEEVTTKVTAEANPRECRKPC